MKRGMALKPVRQAAWELAFGRSQATEMMMYDVAERLTTVKKSGRGREE